MLATLQRASVSVSLRAGAWKSLSGLPRQILAPRKKKQTMNLTGWHFKLILCSGVVVLQLQYPDLLCTQHEFFISHVSALYYITFCKPFMSVPIRVVYKCWVKLVRVVCRPCCGRPCGRLSPSEGRCEPKLFSLLLITLLGNHHNLCALSDSFVLRTKDTGDSRKWLKGSY